MLSIIFIVLGALSLSGSASLGLLIFGSVSLSLVIFGLIVFVLIRTKVFPPSVQGSLLGIFSESKLPPLNAQGNAALEYATRRFNEEKDRINPALWGGFRPPVNTDISYLLVLKSNKYQEVLNLLHMNEERNFKFPDRKYASDEILTSTITEYLQLSFAISIYSLRDLENYRKKYPSVTSNLEALSRQVSAYYRTFYAMSAGYSMIRHLERYCDPAPLQEEIDYRIARFYEAGTVESEWRALFNCFCEQAHWYLGDEQRVRKVEERLFRHSRADLDPSFEYADTTPD
ncbi:hypothetical protein [Chlamydia sp. 12-01]|uniref:hypothetical protein n=1 Tax=Chlamydia sp. 12-01 TaxID=3002742 RepID=UPI0035D40FA9